MVGVGKVVGDRISNYGDWEVFYKLVSVSFYFVLYASYMSKMFLTSAKVSLLLSSKYVVLIFLVNGQLCLVIAPILFLGDCGNKWLPLGGLGVALYYFFM